MFISVIKRKMIRLTVFSMVMTALFYSTGIDAKNSINNLSPRTFIIDTDMDFDDWFSILYMINQPNIILLGLSLEATGTTTCDHSVNNAMNVIQLADGYNVPVACGDGDKTLSGQPLIVVPSYRDDVNRVFGLALPKSSDKPYAGNANELLVNLLTNTNRSVEILTLGPVTNLAKTLVQHPELKNKIKQIYIMGGALNMEGNVHSSNPTIDNTTAEWNFFADVTAMDIVLRSGVPITVVTLDAADQVPITPEFYRTLEDNQSDEKARFVYDVISIISGRSSAYYFWDPLVAVVATHPDVAQVQRMQVKIVTTPGADYGRLVEAKDGTSIDVVTSVNKDAFYRYFLEGITE